MSFVALGARRNMFMAAVQALFGAAVMFISYWLIIASHGLEQVGLWSVLLAIINIVRLFDPSGSHILSRHVAKAYQQRDWLAVGEYIDTLTLFLAVGYTLLCLAMYPVIYWALALIVENDALETARALLPWMLGGILANVLALSHGSAIDGLQRADLRSAAMIASQIALLLLSVLLIPRYGLLGLALAQLLQFAMLVVWSRILLRTKVPGLGFSPRKFRVSRLREIISYGIGVQMISWTGFLGDPLTRLLLNRFGGLEATGIYEIANKLVVQVRMVIAAGAVPLIPAFAAAETHGSDYQVKMIRRGNETLIKLISAAFLALCLASPLVALIMIGEVTASYLLFTLLLTLGWLGNILSMIVYLYGHGVGQLKWNIVGNAAIGASTIILSIPLCPLLGYAGIVAAFSIGLVLSSVIIAWGNTRLIGTSVGAIFPLSTVVCWILPALISGTAALAAANLLLAG